LRLLLSHLTGNGKVIEFDSPSAIQTDITGAVPEITQHQTEVIRSSSEISMTSTERLWALLKAVEYLEENKICGDIVECGVWRGGSSFLVASELAHRNSLNRGIWMFDTFQGMNSPSEHDARFDLKPARQILEEDLDSRATSNNWGVASLEMARSNLLRSGYPEHKMHFVQGEVEVTLRAQAPQKIALARLDTDWYESTKTELDVLMPRMVRGGVVIVDDYGHWLGARKAVDEFLDSTNPLPLVNRIDYTGRMWVVP
jgi:O-methyltransferase